MDWHWQTLAVNNFIVLWCEFHLELRVCLNVSSIYGKKSHDNNLVSRVKSLKNFGSEICVILWVQFLIVHFVQELWVYSRMILDFARVMRCRKSEYFVLVYFFVNSEEFIQVFIALVTLTAIFLSSIVNIEKEISKLSVSVKFYSPAGSQCLLCSNETDDQQRLWLFSVSHVILSG